MPTHGMRRPFLAALAVVLTVAACWIGYSAAPLAAQDEGRMPEFSNRSPAAWVNSVPLSRAGLEGKVVLLEIYTSG